MCNVTASVMASAQDAHDELQEFQQMSRDYETELETELKQCEARNKELHSHNERLRSELENIKVGHCIERGLYHFCDMFKWSSKCKLHFM